ncbi:hypothetical protein MuYL_1222 [Mucilaginibacter xinganensis]|uniref:Uncharacterized protein n=1 Tax=Mucilaginibacter xinganensis TaxID=1234841 RepID=A0A223NTB3_9SPHI|nr:hypothetical protein MuYL_1222 [Mucilaginibacter xinganensis]
MNVTFNKRPYLFIPGMLIKIYYRDAGSFFNGDLKDIRQLGQL